MTTDTASRPEIKAKIDEMDWPLKSPRLA